MQQTFHEKPADRIIMILGLIFALGMLTLSPWYLESMKGPPTRGWVVIIFTSGFFGSMSLLLLLGLIRTWRHYLILEEGRIIQRAILRPRTFELHETTKADWKVGTERKLRLRSAQEKCVIHLNRFTPENEFAIVQFLRASLPEEIQYNWRKYCLSYVQQKQNADLLAREQQVSLGPPGKHYLLRTRRQVDHFFIVFVFLAIIAFVSTCWLVGGAVGLQEVFFLRARGLFVVLLLLIGILGVLWLILRSSVPDEGMYVKHEPRDKALFASLLFPLIGGLGGYHLIDYLAGDWTYKHWLQIAIALISCIPFLVAGHCLDKQREKERMTEDEAIGEWEKLNPPPDSNDI